MFLVMTKIAGDADGKMSPTMMPSLTELYDSIGKYVVGDIYLLTPYPSDDLDRFDFEVVDDIRITESGGTIVTTKSGRVVEDVLSNVSEDIDYTEFLYSREEIEHNSQIIGRLVIE